MGVAGPTERAEGQPGDELRVIVDLECVIFDCLTLALVALPSLPSPMTKYTTNRNILLC